MAGLRSAWNTGAFEGNQTKGSTSFYKRVLKRRKKKKRLEQQQRALSDEEKKLLDRASILGTAADRIYIQRVFHVAIKTGGISEEIRHKLKRIAGEEMSEGIALKWWAEMGEREKQELFQWVAEGTRSETRLFIESLERQFNYSGKLSERQVEALKKFHDNKGKGKFG